MKISISAPLKGSIDDFIFLALAYDGMWSVLSLVSSSRRQCAVSALISWLGGTKILKRISALVGVWTPTACGMDERANH